MNHLGTAGRTSLRLSLLCAVIATSGCEKEPAGTAAKQPAPATSPSSRETTPTVPDSPPPAPGPPAPETAKVTPAPPPAPTPDNSNGATPLPEPPGAPSYNGPVFGLPTKNDALFKNEPDHFYMFVDRYGADGKVTQVWQGGGYGYVRNPRNTASGEVYTKFHEGVDIAPMERDAAGEPQDIVHAICDGTVVFCSPNAASNYGNYVVIEHPCGAESGNFYSLYAHLRRIDTTVGTVVKKDDPIALMGHTGEGIDRRRSHVHLELCMMLSDRFADFYTKFYKLANTNANWHGHNLVGLDVAGFLKAARATPGITPPEFLKTAEKYYTVRVPNKTREELEIVRRYPWLRKPGDMGVSWEISYNTAGVPLSIAPSAVSCAFPTVSWVKPSVTSHSWNSRGHLGGSGSTATLTPDGTKYQQLVTGDF